MSAGKIPDAMIEAATAAVHEMLTPQFGWEVSGRIATSALAAALSVCEVRDEIERAVLAASSSDTSGETP